MVNSEVAVPVIHDLKTKKNIGATDDQEPTVSYKKKNIFLFVLLWLSIGATGNDHQTANS